jgi:hypothetical protein
MRQNLLFLITLLTFATTSFAQGPIDGYMKGKGKLDIAASYSLNNASIFCGAEGQEYTEPFKGSLLSVFAEYGISDRLDVVATVPFVFTNEQNGLQDGSLHLKFRALQSQINERMKLDVLAAAGISAPLSRYEPLAAGAIGQRAQVIQPRLVLQLNTKGPFFNLTAGYNLRVDELNAAAVAEVQRTRPSYVPESPRNYSTFLFKMGLPAARYYLDAWVEHQATTGGTNFAPMVPDLPQAYGVTYTQIGGTAYYSETGKRGVYLSSGYILSGRNVSKVLRLTFGVVIKL